MLTVEKLKEVLSYEPTTGEFIWLVKSRSKEVGSTAGTLDHSGYIHITINRRIYQAHRLAWLHTHGTWPVEHIDHDDGVKSNNRLKNLREATRSQNQFNTGLSVVNTSGFKGVSWDKNRDKFSAKIRLNGKKIFLGYHATAELASAAYNKAAKDNHGVFYKQP